MHPVALGVVLPVLSKLLLVGTLALIHVGQHKLRSVPAPLFRRREAVVGRTRLVEGVLGLGACYTLCATFYFVSLVGQPTGTSLTLKPGDGSPAQQAGLAPGDRAHSVDGKPVKSFEEFRDAVARGPQPVAIEVEREGRLVSLRITKDANDRIGVMSEPGASLAALPALSQAVVAPALAFKNWLRVMLRPLVDEPVATSGPVGIGLAISNGAVPLTRVLAMLMAFDLFVVVLAHVVVLVADARSRARYPTVHLGSAVS